MNTPRQLWADTIKEPYRLARAWALSLALEPHAGFTLSPSERAASGRLSVVVPVHEAPIATRRCLAALDAFGGDAEIVLVDDASRHPDVQAMLQDAKQKGRTLIHHQRARGHSRACEAGVAASSRPYICLLNSDAIITHRSWSGMVEAFESSPAIAVVGPSTSYTSGPQMVRRAMHCRHYWSNEQIWSFAEGYVARHQHAPLTERPFVGGFAFFVRRSMWHELGGFDANLPDYGNEKEFCRRVSGAGHRIVWSKSGYVHHLGKESYGSTRGALAIHRDSAQADQYIERKHGRECPE